MRCSGLGRTLAAGRSLRLPERFFAACTFVWLAAHGQGTVVRSPGAGRTRAVFLNAFVLASMGYLLRRKAAPAWPTTFSYVLPVPLLKNAISVAAPDSRIREFARVPSRMLLYMVGVLPGSCLEGRCALGCRSWIPAGIWRRLLQDDGASRFELRQRRGAETRRTRAGIRRSLFPLKKKPEL